MLLFHTRFRVGLFHLTGKFTLSCRHKFFSGAGLQRQLPTAEFFEELLTTCK